MRLFNSEDNSSVIKEQLEEKIKELRAELNKLHKQCESAKIDIKELAKDKVSVLNDLSRMKEESQKELNDLNAERKKVVEEIEFLSKKFNEEVIDVKKSQDKAFSEINAGRISLKAAEDRIFEKEKELNSLIKSEKDLIESNNELFKKLFNKDIELSKKEDELNSFSKALNELKDGLARKEADIALLSRGIELKRSEVETISLMSENKLRSAQEALKNSEKIKFEAEQLKEIVSKEREDLIISKIQINKSFIDNKNILETIEQKISSLNKKESDILAHQKELKKLINEFDVKKGE